MQTNPFKSKDTFKKAFKKHLLTHEVVKLEEASPRQRYHALGELVFENIATHWHDHKAFLAKEDPRTLHYFSMEFLMGRLITNNLENLGLRDFVAEAFEEMGLDLYEIEHYEMDAGLGNGGLGRLAACFLDSIASLGLAGHGNGIRYRYGFFEQEFKDGFQVEKPDDWLKDGYVWEVRNSEETITIPFAGSVRHEGGRAIHTPDEKINAVPYDVPIVGEGGKVVNHLRLWSAEPTDVYPADKHPFDYEDEVRQISGFLYPDDTTREGKVLRIKQQYFFSAAGVRDIIRHHLNAHESLDNFAEKHVFQINDTHPALIIPEMMRLFVDEHGYGWDEAWNITSKTCAYTNHTLLAEALEKWPRDIMQPVLPRIYQIIEEIDRRYREHLHSIHGDNHEKIETLAIISHGEVRMAHLAIVGSFSVNGVAALHTDILKNHALKDFYEMYPKRFNNKTNGITHRRWLKHINPELAGMLDEISDEWLSKPTELKKLMDKVDDKKTHERFKTMKRNHKLKLKARIEREQGIPIDENSIFDVQIKRMHEYKRQLMNALHIMMVYNRLKRDETFRRNYVPHTFIFGAKAASGYHFAKKVIKLINTIGMRINDDPDTKDYLKVVFVENYNVTYAEQIIPASDISEQISTASKEASGTGNMKLMMNGSLTIGTLDGANVEIADLVGEDNIEIFGMDSEEVNALYEEGGYTPGEIYESNEDIKEVIDQLTNGFLGSDHGLFHDIRDNLLNEDRFFVLKDLRAYQKAHENLNEYYKDQEAWVRSALINIAQSGYFSSDRTIQNYADDIWKLKPLKRS
ncbi:MAG: glycogen/starch/alpha-glucan phosphorylase [Bacillota bacterium]